MNVNISLAGQMITFAILVWVTYRYVWPVLIETIDTRREEIAAKLQEAEEAAAAKDAFAEQGRVLVAEAEDKARKILALAEERSALMVSEAKAEAKREANRMIEQTEARLADEYAKAQAKLNNEVAGLAMQAARGILQKSLGDSKSQDALINALVEN